MRRGDLVTIAVSGDYGKPRPALVVQTDMLADMPSVVVIRLTTDLSDGHPARLTVSPSAANGLRQTSDLMMDKLVAVPRDRIGPVFGQLDNQTMQAVGRGLLMVLDLGGVVA